MFYDINRIRYIFLKIKIEVNKTIKKKYLKIVIYIMCLWDQQNIFLIKYY